MSYASSHALPSDAEKARVQADFAAGRPSRVPVMIYTNARHVVFNPDWNPWGYTYEDCFNDPEAHLRVELQHLLYRRRIIHPHTDDPTELPDRWVVTQYLQNVHDAASLGAVIEFPPGQLPSTRPFESEAQLQALFELDTDRILEWPWIAQRLAFWREMEKLARDMTFEGRPVELLPWEQLGSDGPVTIACNLLGADFLLDLIAEPQRADRLVARITDILIARREAFWAYWGDRIPAFVHWQADDSCAMVSGSMYEDRLMPHHRRLYEHGQRGRPGAAGVPGERSMHLCGDASHLFGPMHRHLGVTCFDTGFPIDHGKVRRELGGGVLIMGGPQVELLLRSSPDEVYERTVEILQSGVMDGGRFILRDANNLPPGVPAENLAAMYAAALDHGRYPSVG